MSTLCGTPEPRRSGRVPGRSYDLRVELHDPDAVRWGFEFTVIGPDGAESGSLAALDADTQVGGNGNRSYGKHTSAGTQEGVTGSAAWTMQWTAPAPGAGDATIYLVGNAANPLNPLTRIAFELDTPQNVRLTVYRVDGRLVRTLADGARGAGRHEESWNGDDDSGRAQPSGTYFYRLQAGCVERTRSMVLIR